MVFPQMLSKIKLCVMTTLKLLIFFVTVGRQYVLLRLIIEWKSKGTETCLTVY